MWFAENVLVKAVMLKDEALLARGRACLLETTVVAQQPGVEGIQPDGSFAQHGMQLYNNGYGFSFYPVLQNGYTYSTSTAQGSAKRLCAMSRGLYSTGSASLPL